MSCWTHFMGITSSINWADAGCVTGRYLTLFTCRLAFFVVRVGYLDSEQLNCRCVLSVIGKCMVWVGQVKVGRLSNGILLYIDNIPSKYLPQREIVSLNLVS